MTVDDIPWWKRTVVYQIYPRSYKDSTGNGIGDLEGIINKLDYLRDLGVETIWFSPFYKSPQEDFGYDISGYREIAPEYGTMETCERLIKEMHDRDMKIVMDMVMNHTSDKHPWFIESRSSKDNPKRDWYIWRDGKKPGGKKPPNNWQSMITGSGWHYDEQTDQWYWAQFLPFQPDLNYRNPEVKAEMLDTMRFWLDKGADGFRLDIINAVYEDEMFRNNPASWRLLPSEKSPAMLFKNPKYTLNHPDTLEFMKELRSVMDEYDDPPRFLVGEVSAPLYILKDYMGEQADGLHLTFQFQSLGLKLKAKKIKKIIKEYERNFSGKFLPTWVFANHDRFRRISRLGGSIPKAKLNTALQMTARGVPFIYYGEEIGMEQHKFHIKNSLDAVTFKFKKIPQIILNIFRALMKETLNRDECRTPMQWTPGENAGFCPPDVDPWLPITDSYKERNVAVEDKNLDSLLHCYKRFLEVRNTYPALNSGALELLEGKQMPKKIVAYRRLAVSGKDANILVLLNCSKKALTFPNQFGSMKLIVSTHLDAVTHLQDEITMHGLEGSVFKTS